MDAHLIQSIIFLLMIACMVASLAQWLKQPYTIALVIVGLVVALTNLTPMLHISHDVTFMQDNWKSPEKHMAFGYNYLLRAFDLIVINRVTQAVAYLEYAGKWDFFAVADSTAD